MASYEVTNSNDPNGLIAGTEVSTMTTLITVLAGRGKLERGSVVGVISASKKGKLCDSASADGSEVAKYILSEDIDTTSGDVKAVCYKSGVFNRNKLTLGGTDTPADHEEELRDVNIQLKDSISY